MCPFSLPSQNLLSGRDAQAMKTDVAESPSTSTKMAGEKRFFFGDQSVCYNEEQFRATEQELYLPSTLILSSMKGTEVNPTFPLSVLWQ